MSVLPGVKHITADYQCLAGEVNYPALYFGIRNTGNTLSNQLVFTTTNRTLVKPAFIEHIYMGQNHVEAKLTKFAKQ